MHPSSLRNQQNTDIVVKVLAASINPADYKIPELGLLSRAVISTPATPGMDFCGRIAATGSAIDNFRVGEIVFGRLSDHTKYGSLAEYIVCRAGDIVSKPDEVEVEEAAPIATVGISAYQAIVPYVSEGDKMYVHGGSGGVGSFAVQIAKVLGCEVVTSCSSSKVQFVKELGADEVIDYQNVDVVTKLKELAKEDRFKLVVDCVGTPAELYRESNDFLDLHGNFIQIGGEVSLAGVKATVSRMFIPGFLGGGTRSYSFLSVKQDSNVFSKLGQWIKEGKLKVSLDQIYEFEDAPKAFERLKSGKVKGKIVIRGPEF
jgi:NADPH:quinone reductase-like Zn-dependent oxidoreductase